MANILIVDDSKFMRNILADILLKEGYQISGEAENAMECVEMYHRLKPDLITLDIIMPMVENMDAIDAVREIMEANPLARVIVVSSMGQHLMIQEYLQAGVCDFIVKPFEPSNVVRVVREALEGVYANNSPYG